MVFPESFWVAVGAAAPVIALANVVTMNDSLSVPDLQALVKRSSFSGETFIGRQARRGAWVLFWSCLLSAINLTMQTVALIIALGSLSSGISTLPPQAAIVIEAAGLMALAPIAGLVGVANRIQVRIEEEVRKAEGSKQREEFIKQFSTLPAQILNGRDNMKHKRHLLLMRNRRR